MNNPGGETRHGIPYPASDETHPTTPNHLKAVAERIDELLDYGTVPGIVIRMWAGAVQLDGSANGRIDPAWLGLSRMDGAMVQLAYLGAGETTGSSRTGWATACDGDQFNVIGTNEFLNGNANQNDFKNELVTVFVTAWGAPAPTTRRRA